MVINEASDYEEQLWIGAHSALLAVQQLTSPTQLSTGRASAGG